MRTEDLIVELARSAEPVRPLPAPPVRTAQWTIGAVVVAALGVLVIHPRADIATAMLRPAFGGLAIAIAITALVSAAGAFALSVPGASRPLQRVAPALTGGLWALLLIALLGAGGNSWPRVLALPIHSACIAEIIGLGLVPAWVLFKMLRRAAPIDRTWSAALATLAAVSWSALATQIICPIDDPAHQLVGHFGPVVCSVVFGALAGRRWLAW